MCDSTVSNVWNANFSENEDKLETSLTVSHFILYMNYVYYIKAFFNHFIVILLDMLRTSRMRCFGHVERRTGWISEVRKLNVVALKRSGRPRKSWDEVIKNDREKLDMDSADPENRSEWRGRLRGRLVKKPNPR